jgi:hypothetical protein
VGGALFALLLLMLGAAAGTDWQLHSAARARQHTAMTMMIIDQARLAACNMNMHRCTQYLPT